jgi:hypothetical protein
MISRKVDGFSSAHLVANPSIAPSEARDNIRMMIYMAG